MLSENYHYNSNFSFPQLLFSKKFKNHSSIILDKYEYMEDLNFLNDYNNKGLKEDFIQKNLSFYDDKDILLLKDKKDNTLDMTTEKSLNRINNHVSSINVSDNINSIFTQIRKIKINNLNQKEISENKVSSSNFIHKKRKIFKINKTEKLQIFSHGKASSNIRISQILHSIKENNNFEEKNESYENKNQKKKKVRGVCQRKDNSDDIRVKVKRGFLHYLKLSVNKRLNSSGSKKKFKNLPQIFISNVTKKTNNAILDLSFKEIYSKDFFIGKSIPDLDLKRLNNNISVIKYLEKNKEIANKSNYNTFKNMTFRQIFNEYLKSKEFEKEVHRLRKVNDKEYISKYVIKANHLIEFFSNLTEKRIKEI